MLKDFITGFTIGYIGTLLVYALYLFIMYVGITNILIAILAAIGIKLSLDTWNTRKSFRHFRTHTMPLRIGA